MKAKQERERLFVALLRGDSRPLSVSGGLAPRRKVIGTVRGDVTFPADLVAVAYGATIGEAMVMLGNGCKTAGLTAYWNWCQAFRSGDGNSARPAQIFDRHADGTEPDLCWAVAYASRYQDAS